MKYRGVAKDTVGFMKDVKSNWKDTEEEAIKAVKARVNKYGDRFSINVVTKKEL